MRAVLLSSIVVCAWLWAPLSADAQPDAPKTRPGDTVIVTGQKLAPEAIEKFVQSYAAPSLYLGKIARWKTAICPTVTGLNLDDATPIIQRIMAVAATIGAPVTADSSCTGNIEIMFTDAPQKLLDEVRDHQPYLVGYSRSPEQAGRLATVSHPIQAWYATQWEDNNGRVHPDDRADHCGGINFKDAANGSASCATSASNMGLRTGINGLRSEFFNILIVVNTDQSQGAVQASALADYLAMLALVQTQSFETCQALPSITNLVSPNCEPGTKSTSLTDTDLAFLRAVYKARPDKVLNQQLSDIAGEMAKGRAAE